MHSSPSPCLADVSPFPGLADVDVGYTGSAGPSVVYAQLTPPHYAILLLIATGRPVARVGQVVPVEYDSISVQYTHTLLVHHGVFHPADAGYEDQVGDGCDARQTDSGRIDGPAATLAIGTVVERGPDEIDNNNYVLVTLKDATMDPVMDDGLESTYYLSSGWISFCSAELLCGNTLLFDFQLQLHFSTSTSFFT